MESDIHLSLLFPAGWRSVHLLALALCNQRKCKGKGKALEEAITWPTVVDFRIFGLPAAFRFGLANEGMFSFSFSSRSAMLIEALPDIFLDISVCRSWIL